MANPNNNPSITDDEIKKAKEYTDAMDKLKSAISGVNSKLPEFSDGLQAGLKALGEKLPDVVEAITKLNAQNKELAASGQKPLNVLSQLGSSMFSWNSLISVGITLLATYSGAIINWISDLLKGQTQLSALGKTMKDAKIIMEAVNQSRSQGQQNAQAELTNLKLLYNATQNQNLALEERKNAIKAIRDQYPDYFRAISDDTILHGKAIKQYNDLTNAIIASSRAKAAEEIMTKNQIRQLGNEGKTTGLTTQLNNYEAQLKIAQKEYNDVVSHPVIGGSSFAPGSDSGEQKAYSKLAEIKERRNELKKTLADLNTDSKLLDGQNEALMKSVSSYTEKYGTKILTNLKTLNEVTKSNINKTKDKSYWETELVNQQMALNKLEAGTKDFETKSKPIIQRIRAINKTLSNYSVGEIKKEPSTKTARKETEEELTAKEKVYQGSLIKQMQATANALAKKAELQHNSYTEEQSTLKRLYDNKLISQEQYQQESTQLEEKYHVGIGEIIKRMNAEDLEKVQKQQKDLVETQQQKELLTKDQRDVDKAILPWNKLEAEKKLITDKYNFEIQKAAEAGKDTAALRLEYQEKITEATKKSEEQRKAFAIQAAQEISSKAFSLISNSIKSSSEAKIKGLESDKAKELSNTNLTKSQKAAIEAKYKKKENDEKVKAFKAEQKLQIAQALINGAIAVTKTLSTMALPAAIPFIAADVAMTAIQIATIASQKPPQFARGGQFISDGRGALLPGYSRTDNTNAHLRSGEAVVVSEAMRNPWARNLVSAINVAHGGRDFSAPNPGKGYAIGGIFTDGGNANRYYNQPVNDVKELANTVAYQMINNFPPIYVDVKDVNNQQNILAQTVDRVNL